MNNLDNFGEKVSKICFELSGIKGIEKYNNEWWKIKTSFFSIVEKAFYFNFTKQKFLKIKIKEKDIYLGENKNGINVSTFGQYFRVWLTFGVIDFDEEFNNYNKFSSLIKNIKTIKFSNYFLTSNDATQYFLEMKPIDIIQKNLFLLKGKSFLADTIIKTIFTISIYITKFYFNYLDEVMCQYISGTKNYKISTKNSIIAEYKGQRKIVKLIKIGEK
ncbi:hypothetical protein [Spiroplasma endosymbiont of Crioceris asparagi]|uniref:hypothetical protein n=1 Tax=Spiroplasma endosymbiont of Crioceris asparagi TaxID=3066286 RepID=UPI0030D591D4